MNVYIIRVVVIYEDFSVVWDYVVATPSTLS